MGGSPPGPRRSLSSARSRLASEAASDRVRASQDRLAGATERSRAGADRDGASADRHAGAGQRTQAGADRDIASADRRAGAEERTDAELDRDTALADRGAGASERTEAELDRDTALADRGAGASERTEAELDRDTALADRGASAREREDSSLDALTGAYLRGAGFQELAREIARARRTAEPFVLAFVDVDGLKAINDSGGHAAGDQMLRETADALRAHLRSHDLIIRYGGDEFVCAVAGLSLADATARLGLVNTALARAPQPGSMTVGFAELQPEDSPQDLMARADAALYRERAGKRAAGG